MFSQHDIDECRSFGANSIANLTAIALDAVSDEEKVREMMQTLTAFADRPHDDEASLDEMGLELIQLICNAHAVLVASDLYADDDANQQAMAKWLRRMATTFLKQAADTFSKLAVAAAERKLEAETPRTLN